MPSFSRWTTRTPEPTLAERVRAWGVLGAVAFGGLWLLVAKPLFVAVLIALLACAWVASLPAARRAEARLRVQAAEREGDSLCSFVRALPKTEREPRIVRAVWEELTVYRQVDGQRVPVRLEDRLDALDLGVDLDETAEDIAQRAGRDFAAAARNPYAKRVKTVHDLVRFMAALPTKPSV